MPDATRPGAVYLYDQNGSTISNEIKISPPEGAADYFGLDIHIDSNKLIVVNSKIYVYNLNGTLESSFIPDIDPGPLFDDVMSAVYVAVGDNKIAVAHRRSGQINIYDFSGNLEYSHTNLHGELSLSSVAIGDGKVAVGSS